MNNIYAENTAKINVQLAKNVLARKLSMEEASLLMRNPKNWSDSDLELVVPLSKYYNWLNAAQDTALELVDYAQGLKMDISPAMYRDLVYYTDNQAKSMMAYYKKAIKCYTEYQKIIRKREMKAMEQAEAPACDKTSGQAVVLPVKDNTVKSA